jgi:uncharacterized protein
VRPPWRNPAREAGVTVAFVDLPPSVTAAVSAVVEVARAQGPTSCAALVGSWAADRATPASDVDLVVLVEQPERLLDFDGWYSTFAQGVTLIRQADFGAVQERRLRLPDGLVVEVGVSNLSWASTTPVDLGTRRVAQDGLLPLLDPQQRLADLVRRVIQEG